jgi:cation diffusion facilitator CzcD-associated flavoprotein CzcO
MVLNHNMTQAKTKYTLASATDGQTDGGHPELDVLIIGAGFAGICMGIRLLEAGMENFRIFEKAPKVGGTWYFNSYPGAACDVASHFYCFSFEPNPDWSRKFSPWNEIQEYAEHCVDKYSLRPQIEYGREVSATRFDDQSGLWEVSFSDGTVARAHHLVNGCGGLHVPSIPEFEGAQQFEGQSWHSSLWRHDIDLRGKRVAVIGSAASAVQIVPEIAKLAKHVSLFQRTANYIVPRDDREYSTRQKQRFRRWPWLLKLYRLFLFLRYELLIYPIVKTHRRNIQRIYGLREFRRYLKTCVPNRDLREKLTPDYPLGCKRILISDNFFQAFSRDNVTLVTAGISHLTARGVQTVDGVEHAADIIVYATGFDTQSSVPKGSIVGPGGYDLSDAWQEAPIAYEGSMVAGFPNYYFVTGPNTGVGSTSVIFMIEQQANLILACIKAAGLSKLIAPSAAAMRAYDQEIQGALSDTVWATSCSSWYKREDGRITILYPYNAMTFRRRHKKPKWADFEIEAVPAVGLGDLLAGHTQDVPVR